MGVKVGFKGTLKEFHELQKKEEDEKEIKLLKAQLKAATDRADFQEELIAELAMKVYE